MESARSWREILDALSARHNLSQEQSSWAMDQIMAGTAANSHIAAFVMGLRSKGETSDEISGMVTAILDNAIRVDLHGPAVDIVGTGGDGSHSVNISTMAAFVIAGCGIPVLKHGNRAISSRSGTADVLESLGINLSMPASVVASCLADAGMAFCFAPAHHPGFRHAGEVRKELGIPTVFNVLGPLCNPGQPPAALIGCADLRLAPVLAQVQSERGFAAAIVRSDEGLDEITTAGTTQVWDVTTSKVRHEVLTFAGTNIVAASRDDLLGGDASQNAQVVRDVLGANTEGRLKAIRDVVAVNAAAALVVFDATQSTQLYGATNT
ncbi:MAG: anthranilate phosphoribosyltransferase, partial [Actinobacteria bacterium]|nr:anthranilate phosphoribosyltransferase [Actinomycetota bacterium]